MRRRVSSSVSATIEGNRLGMEAQARSARDDEERAIFRTCRPNFALSWLCVCLVVLVVSLSSSITRRRSAQSLDARSFRVTKKRRKSRIRRNRVIVAVTFHPLQIILSCDCSAGSVSIYIVEATHHDSDVGNTREAQIRTPAARCHAAV